MLNKLNGWQRLWLCATGAALLICGIIWPWLEVVNGRNSPSRWDYDNAIRKEIATGRCGDYINKPIPELKEPSYTENNDNCYHIYNTRYFDEKQRPYNEAAYAETYSAKTRIQALEWVLVCSLGVLLAGSLVYFVGWMVAWIRRGFSADRT